MIPFDFSYARPDTAEEAVSLWHECKAEGGRPYYYAGGTEIITLCRDMKIKPDLVIDIKAIKACHLFEQGKTITYGAALSLNEVAEQSASRLVTHCLTAIGDQTVRNQITLGGNILGHLPFREALLPFLVLGGRVNVVGENGPQVRRLIPYNKRLHLNPGELVTSFSLDPDKIDEPSVHIRKQKDGPVDYPILSACFAGPPGNVSMAVSGAFSSPVRDPKSEAVLNQTALSIKQRSEAVVQGLSPSFKSDIRASAQYKQHLLKLAIISALEEIEG